MLSQFSQKIGLTSALVLLGVAVFSPVSVSAQTAPPLEDSPEIAVGSFEPPAYERQPLPDALNTAQAWQTVGMNAVQVEDYANGLAAFDKAVDLSARANPEILEQRGWLHALAGYYDEAIADLEAAAAQYTTQNQHEQALNALQIRDFVVLRQDNQLGATPAPSAQG